LLKLVYHKDVFQSSSGGMITETLSYPYYCLIQKMISFIFTDASTKEWGAVRDAEKTGGRLSDEEAKNHINSLELMAIFFGLEAFCKNE